MPPDSPYLAGRNARSPRRVPFGQLALEALERRCRAADGEKPHKGNAVVATARRRPVILRANLRRDHWRPLLERAEITNLRIHDLRHAATTIGLAAGVNPKTMAGRLGYATTTVMMDRYAHNAALAPRTRKAKRAIGNTTKSTPLARRKARR